MADVDTAQQVDEILAALETAGQIESWLEQRLDRAAAPAVIEQVYREVTKHLLVGSSPRMGDWDHLLTATAQRSTSRDGRVEFTACKSAIGELTEIMRRGEFKDESSDHAVMIASALVMALTAQRKLRQYVEIAINELCRQFPAAFALMAEQCQDIWQRRGQMSGAEGMFVWDTRRDEWRLNQDFRPFRPT